MALTKKIDVSPTREPKLVAAVAPPFPLWAVYYYSDTDEVSTAPILFFLIQDNGAEEAAITPIILLDGEIEQEPGGGNYLGLTLTATPNRADVEQAIARVKMREAAEARERRGVGRK